MDEQDGEPAEPRDRRTGRRGHQPRARSRTTWTAGIVLFALCNIAIYQCGINGSSANSSNAGAYPGVARSTCHGYVRNLLVAPDSATFESPADAEITARDELYTVVGFVQSENDSGDMIRNDYVCVASRAPDYWTLESMSGLTN